MVNLIWRIRFAWHVKQIFSKPKGFYTGNHFALGWKISKKMDMTIPPKLAALEEITNWYCE